MESKETSIARVCHEANKAYCISIGDDSQKSWDEAGSDIRYSAVSGVNFRLMNPEATAADQHESWYSQKQADGWKYGPVKDPETKQHPCMVTYEELPIEQQKKDKLFSAIVTALK